MKLRLSEKPPPLGGGVVTTELMPEIELSPGDGPDDGNDDGPEGAPTRTRTWEA